MNAAIIGFGLGFFVALQLGPMSLFLIRSTLRSGWRVGAAIGAGIATVDGLYAAAGAGGAAPLLIDPPAAPGARACRRDRAHLARSTNPVRRVPRPSRRRNRFGNCRPTPRVPDRVGWDRIQPVDDRVVGGHLRCGEHSGARAHDRFGNHPRGWCRYREPDLGHIARNRCRTCGSIDEPAFDSSDRRCCRRRADWIWWRTRVHDIGSPGRNRTCAHGLGNRRSIH